MDNRKKTTGDGSSEKKKKKQFEFDEGADQRFANKSPEKNPFKKARLAILESLYKGEGKGRSQFRKGCCQNCGSQDHKDNFCFDRPRAKVRSSNLKTEDDQAPREVSTSTSQAQTETSTNRSEVSTSTSQAQTETSTNRSEVSTSTSQAQTEEEEEKSSEEEKSDFSRHPSGSRNPRDREDLAKYLMNLDPDSAFYNPKTRSMFDDPFPFKPDDQKTYKGDADLRNTGDAHEFAAVSTPLQSAPTQTFLSYKKQKQKKEAQKQQKKD